MNYTQAPKIHTGTEDKFHYVISDSCRQCGVCEAKCPVNAISLNEKQYVIHPSACIDCGTCSAVCPVGAIAPVPYLRESIRMEDIDWSNCYFNAGCALSLYKPEVPQRMLALLQKEHRDVRLHTACCRHQPNLKSGATIINNCAGCDRRFRSLYDGIQTISYWEVLDAMEGITFPDYHGMTVSVHDSCGYRHKPQVHKAIRNLLKKMNLNVVEAEYSGTQSVCCGDNFYGYVPNEEVEKRIQMRADRFPCDNVVVYCIGCIRAMEAGGKTPCYLPDLLLGRKTEAMADSLDLYHSKLSEYIKAH